MKANLLFIILLFPLFSTSQIFEIQTVSTSRGDFKVINKKWIYEVVGNDSERLLATIKGNKLYNDSSSNEKDVLFTVVGEKVYKTAIINSKNLLLYLKGQDIFLRTKAGGFAMAGGFRQKGSGKMGLMAMIEPLEYFAVCIAAKLYD